MKSHQYSGMNQHRKPEQGRGSRSASPSFLYLY
jgi:hypothetical protein